MSQWTTSNPGAGSPADIRAGAGRRTSDAASARSAGASVVMASVAATSGWKGLASDALRASIDPLAAELNVIAAQAESDAATLLRYAGEVEAIQQSQNTIASHLEDLTYRRRTLRRRVTDASVPLDSGEQRSLRYQLSSVDYQMTGLNAQMAALVQQRTTADTTAIMSLTGIASRGSFSPFGGILGADTSRPTLHQLEGLSEVDLATLLTLHPELTDVVQKTTNPGDVSAWWAQLTLEQQQTLAIGAAGLIGALGGIPAHARAAANRVNAASRVAWLDAEIARVTDAGYRAGNGQVYAPSTAVATYLSTLQELRAERDYLQRAVDGSVQLYLYNHQKGEIIEMLGNPSTADAIMTFMPGTNTTMDSFYTSTATTGITALTRWEVENPRLGYSVAGFVVKQGAFPQLDGDLMTTGPQNNDMAETLGAKYASFAGELHVIAPHAPLVSVEHSFGSAVGGVAETKDANFAARIALSGIGMTSDYGPSLETQHYAMQSPNDILTQLDVKGFQVFNWGYSTPPDAEHGFTELDSGIPGTPIWTQLMAPLSPPIAAAGDLMSGLDHHNQIISGNVNENRVVLEVVRDIVGSQRR